MSSADFSPPFSPMGATELVRHMYGKGQQRLAAAAAAAAAEVGEGWEQCESEHVRKEVGEGELLEEKPINHDG